MELKIKRIPIPESLAAARLIKKSGAEYNTKPETIAIALEEAVKAIVRQREAPIKSNKAGCNNCGSTDARSHAQGCKDNDDDERMSAEFLRGHIGKRRGDKGYSITLNGEEIDDLLREHEELINLTDNVPRECKGCGAPYILPANESKYCFMCEANLLMAKKNKTVNTLAGWAEIFNKQDEQLSESMNRILQNNSERDENLSKMKTLFHKLWGEAHDSPDYVKQNWEDMRELLKKLGVTV